MATTPDYTDEEIDEGKMTKCPCSGQRGPSSPPAPTKEQSLCGHSPRKGQLAGHTCLEGDTPAKGH